MAASYDFSNKVILITGATGGIGQATALAFAKAHAKAIVLADLPSASASASTLVSAITAVSPSTSATFYALDVTAGDQVAACVHATVARFGSLDVAFNNAGVLSKTASLIDTPDEEYDRTLGVDLKGVFLGLKHEIRQMLAQDPQGGVIVNSASIAGILGGPMIAPYVAAKHGVIGLTKTAALEYAAQGVRVNAIAPSAVATEMIQHWLQDPAQREYILGGIPVKRAATVEEIANSVLYLCSDAAGFVNGATLVLDAGQTVQ
ncbi:2,5-dichloro-2,5-cyclohexadiene-1,4-diol dehydrogenase [Myxozyma melibiosi]|uniref:2,5-dichloro-2,5-cyclohexadiene-1,4-diol dehydrogenase n=1 Tax=Myxozyma melibiosi TaxID=54550 RepID=A0ABR1F9X8_9ASCO